MKRNRHVSYKIPDIKALRSLTRLLGKLNIRPCYFVYEDLGYVDYCNNRNFIIDNDRRFKTSYGYGLAESKVFVEQWINYTQELSPTEVPWTMFPRN
jgi:hypothetical protein